MIALRAVALTLALSCALHNKPSAAPISQNDTDHDNLIASADSCPDDPEDVDGYKDEDGCPDCDHDVEQAICVYLSGSDTNCPGATPDDHDGDAIPNGIDQCPEIPEDMDGFQDQDGCPEPDNDDDCLFDQADKCPNEPGPVSAQGCPR